MQVYPSIYFKQFHPNKEFEKWATVEVDDFKNIPDGMKSFIVKEGVYAVFQYKGLSSDTKLFEYIFSEWMPKSLFEIADRPVLKFWEKIIEIMIRIQKKKFGFQLLKNNLTNKAPLVGSCSNRFWKDLKKFKE